MLSFRNERHHGTGNLKKGLFLGHLQPPLRTNSEDLTILILECDDVTVKTPIVSFLLSSGIQKEVQLGIQFGGSRFVSSLLSTSEYLPSIPRTNRRLITASIIEYLLSIRQHFYNLGKLVIGSDL